MPDCCYKQLKQKEQEYECAIEMIKELQKRFGKKLKQLKIAEETLERIVYTTRIDKVYHRELAYQVLQQIKELGNK